MNQDQFAHLIEQAYKDALAAADAIKESAAADREAAWQELQAAKDARRAAEAEGEKMAEEYFEKRREAFAENARRELLAQLVQKHLEAGKPKTEIAEWLDVGEDFVEDLRAKFAARKPTIGDARLEYAQYGRGGTVTYTKGKTRLTFDWEFGGGDAVSLIFVPREEHWVAQTGLPLTERPAVLEFVAQQAVRDQAPNCKYRIRADVIEVYRG